MQPGAANCHQAGTLEAAGDLTQSLGTLGVLGIVLWAAILLAGRRRPRTASVLPPALGPALGAATFGSATVGLATLAVGNAALPGIWGRGLWWSSAACTLAAAAVSGWYLLRALSHDLTADNPR